MKILFAQGLWQISALFYRWQRIIRWSFLAGCGLGLAGALLAVLTSEYQPHGRGLLILGACFAVILPIIPMPVLARELLSNPHLRLVPGLQPAVGLALLLQSLILALLIAGLAEARGDDALLSGTRSFVAISLYHFLMLWFVSSRLLPALLIGLTLASVVLIKGVTALDQAGWFELTPILLFALGIAGVWGWGIQRLWYGRLFSAKVPDHHALAIAWANRLGQRLASASPLGRLLGYPTSLRERLVTAVNVLLSAPFVASALMLLAVLLVDPVANQNIQPDWRWFADLGLAMLLSISLINAILASSGFELVKRTRLLWLRHRGQRGDLWQDLETLVLINIGSYCLMSLFAAGLALLSSAAQPYVLPYLGGIVSGTLLATYLSMAFALGRLSIPVGMLSAALGTGFCYGLLLEEPAFTWGSQLGALCLAGLLRQRTRATFLQVDWTTVRPNTLNRSKLSTVRLW